MGFFELLSCMGLERFAGGVNEQLNVGFVEGFSVVC